jgi:hypothetical protein
MCSSVHDDVADDVCCPAIKMAIIMCEMSVSVSGTPFLYVHPVSAEIMSCSSVVASPVRRFSMMER